MNIENQTGGDLNFGMTDLEEKLTAEGGAAAKAEILQRLIERGQEVKAQMDKGLPSEAYKQAEAAYQALAAAHEIIFHFPANAESQD